MAETIYFKLGEMRVEKNKGVFKSPEGGRKTYTKDQFDIVATSRDGYKYVGLKAYDISKLDPEDAKIIRSHGISKTDNGIEYYTFNRGRTLEEIKQVKQCILESLNKSVFPVRVKERDDTIFGSIAVEFSIPKMVIEKQKMEEEITWNCWDDQWRDPSMENQDRQLLEVMYKRNGKARGNKDEKTNN
jgi:hypothetical protein